jgi:CDP-ribitol ribitolphosphotransferase
MSYKISVITPAYNAEAFLRETLDSLVNQTFKNFEVIIVNDGSTDSTSVIIEEYCEKYSNFKSFTQHNSGVSTARNKGIEEASGEYLAFLDSDDIYAPKALEKMYKVAFENDAELVVGISGHFNSFHSPTHLNTETLVEKEFIDSFDEGLIWTFSQSNKLFLRDKVNETNSRFPNLKYAEDGAFVLRFAYQCNRIIGCPFKVVSYRKHDFWEGTSATQNNNVEYIYDYLKAHELIYASASNGLKNRIENAKTSYEIAKVTTIYYEYLDNLLYRRIAILFNEFYRLFWKTDNTSLALINDTIQSIKKDLLPDSWIKLKKSFADLFIDNLIYNRSDMAENPIITLVVDPGKISREDLILTLKSIYSQNFPAFEVLIPKRLSNLIPSEIVDYENLYFIDSKDKNLKNYAIKKAKGEYISFIEDNVILDPLTLKSYIDKIYDSKYVMVSCKIGKFNDYKTSNYYSQEIVYPINGVNLNKKSKFNYLDLGLSNKLISIAYLNSIEFNFSDTASDVKRLYDETKFIKLSKTCVYSSKDENKLLNSFKSRNKSIRIKSSILSFFTKPIYYIFLLKRLFLKFFTDDIFNRTVKTYLKNKFFDYYIKLLKLLPLRNRVFFYSIRANNRLLENNLYVYGGLDKKKIFFTRTLPHSNKVQMKMLYYLLTNKVIVTDDYLRYLRQFKKRKGQTVIQQWHACGVFKKFGLDHPSNDIETEIKTHSQYDHVIVSSDDIRECYASAFGLTIDKIEALGIPRTDMFFDENSKKTVLDKLYQQYPQLKDKKIVLYSPTFRESAKHRIIPLDTKIDWESLNSSLNDDELFIINKHPIMKEDLLNGKNYSKIIDLSNASTYALMFASDIMITDYSSVIFEYSLLNKPIIFYCPDKYTRDFYLNYPDDLPGEMINNSEELIKKINSLLQNPYTENLEHFKMKYMGACDGNSTRRVVKLIESSLKK